MAIRVSSSEDAGCFCFNLDSGLTRALPKERSKRVLCPLFNCTTGNMARRESLIMKNQYNVFTF